MSFANYSTSLFFSYDISGKEEIVTYLSKGISVWGWIISPCDDSLTSTGVANLTVCNTSILNWNVGLWFKGGR